MKIATPKKVHAKLWLPTNTRWNWIPSSRWHGPEWRGRTSGIAAFATEGGLKAFDAHLSSARDATARALAIEPNLPEALLARASIETNFDFNWNGAAQTLRKALALAPADPNIADRSGKPRDSTWKHGSSDRTLSPGSRGGPGQRASSARFSPVNLAAAKAIRGSARRIPAGDRVESGGTVGITPVSASPIYSRANWKRPRLRRRLTLVSGRGFSSWLAPAGVKNNSGIGCRACTIDKDFAETAAYQIAEVYAYRGDKDKAFEWLDRARRQRDAGLAGLREDPLLTNLHR